MPDTQKGLRFSRGKIRFYLVPWEYERALARHFHVGAFKYAPRNWEKGMKWSEIYDPIRRHLDKFMSGSTYDEETGSHHLISAAWGCCVLFVYWWRRIGENDLLVPDRTPEQPLWGRSVHEEKDNRDAAP